MTEPTTLRALLEGADVRTFDYDFLDVAGDASLRLTRAQARGDDATLDEDGTLESAEGDVTGVRTITLGKGSPLKVTGRASDAHVRAGTTVRFTATVEGVPDGEAARVRWSFPNGQRLEGDGVTHAFAKAGRFAVVVGATTRSQRAGASDIVTVVVGAAPEASATPSPSPTATAPPAVGAAKRRGDGGVAAKPRATETPSPTPTPTPAPTATGRLVTGVLLGGTSGGGDSAAPKPSAEPTRPDHAGLDVPPGAWGAGAAILLALVGFRLDMRRARPGWR